MAPTWFLFDLGNTIIKLAYERVLENVCREATSTRDELLQILEQPGGYRDMERGTVTFWDFYESVCEKAGYRGSIRDFHETWSDFFEGPIAGIEHVLERVREKYRIAFLSNSNEVHAEVIPRKYAALFRPTDKFLFSYRFGVAKPDPEIYRAALQAIEATAGDTVFVDDLIENVIAARRVGIRSYQFTGSADLVRLLEGEGLL
ncbi:MAG TPA: HAD family phosphatase [Thermoanaerobaculia bacterium]|nr:HAD family phosphatase [Thermoanaerobaculia bacterium]